MTQLGTQVVKKGDTLLVLPVAPDDAPVALKSAVALRNAATVRGRCGCGATVAMASAGPIMVHEIQCPASDEAIAALLETS